jgi:probable HAF family extracellular repeat protein
MMRAARKLGVIAVSVDLVPLFCVGFSAPASAAQPYTIADIGSLGGSGGQSQAVGINAAGDVVGSSGMTGGAAHAALFKNGTLTDLGASLAGDSVAVSVNSSDVAVGSAFGGPDAVEFSGGHAVVLTATATIGRTGTHGVVFSGGSVVDLTTLLPAGSGWTSIFEAPGINDAGQIVGWGTHNGVTRGFVMTPPPSPTKEAAGPASKLAGTFSATLTRSDNGAPINGQTVVFSTRSLFGAQDTVCTAITDAKGVASCTGRIPLLDRILDNSYTATFPGNSAYLSSSATGQLR